MEGVNMGRKCPWTKEEIIDMYNKVNGYCKMLTLRILATEGQGSAIETMAAYNMFKYPIVYLFIHYHYGVFEDLSMDQNDISSYMMYVTTVKHFTQGMKDGMMEQNVFYYDKNNVIAPNLVKICDEVLLIEDNK